MGWEREGVGSAVLTPEHQLREPEASSGSTRRPYPKATPGCPSNQLAPVGCMQMLGIGGTKPPAQLQHQPPSRRLSGLPARGRRVMECQEVPGGEPAVGSAAALATASASWNTQEAKAPLPNSATQAWLLPR